MNFLFSNSKKLLSNSNINGTNSINDMFPREELNELKKKYKIRFFSLLIVSNLITIFLFQEKKEFIDTTLTPLSIPLKLKVPLKHERTKVQLISPLKDKSYGEVIIVKDINSLKSQQGFHTLVPKTLVNTIANTQYKYFWAYPLGFKPKRPSLRKKRWPHEVSF